MNRDERLRKTNQRLCHVLERRYPQPFEKRHEAARAALVAALRASPDDPQESLDALEYRETALRQYERAIAAADRSVGR